MSPSSELPVYILLAHSEHINFFPRKKHIKAAHSLKFTFIFDNLAMDWQREKPVFFRIFLI